MTAEAPTSAPRLIDSPDEAPATVLLAHGPAAPMDSPCMAAIASGLAESGWRVVRFEFPYMARMRETGRRQGPDRMPVLQESFRQQVRLELAASDGVRSCVPGYPFHPPGKPLQLRTGGTWPPCGRPPRSCRGSGTASGAARRWRPTASRRRCSCVGYPAVTTASSPPAVLASSRRRTGPRRWPWAFSFFSCYSKAQQLRSG